MRTLVLNVPLQEHCYSWSQDSQPVLRIRYVYPGSQIPDPDCPSRIPDQKQRQKSRVKKISCPTFFSSHKSHKIKNYFIFEQVKKKTLGQFTTTYRTFYPKIVLSFQKYGSGIRKKSVPDPGVKKAPDPGSAKLLST
jgi:hypothetical protein